MSEDQPTFGFSETLAKAIADEPFRNQLFADPDGTTKALGLSPGDQKLIAAAVRDKREAIEKSSRDFHVSPEECCMILEFKGPRDLE